MSHDDPLDALIATAKAHDVPPEDAENRAWAAFAGTLGGGGGGLPGAPEVAGKKGIGLALKIAGSVVLASVTGVGVAQWSTPGETPPPASHVSAEAPSPGPVTAERSPTHTRVATSDAPVAPVLPPATMVDTPASPATPPSKSPPRTHAVATPEPLADAPDLTRSASTLAEEARLVGSMWKALERGEAKRALSLAQAHGARFEDGALGLEARAAALAARCLLGRPTDLAELDAVNKLSTPSIAKRISSACAKKP